MDSPRTTNRPRLVSRAKQIPALSFRALFQALPTPKLVWGSPDGTTVVGGGAATTVESNSADRFGEIDAGIADVFRTGDVHAGTEAARPRVFGGFSFHGRNGEDPLWNEFPDARFILPQIQVTRTDGDTWLTVTEFSDDARGERVEDRLDAEAQRLADQEPAESQFRVPGIVNRTRTTTKDAWRSSIEAATARIERGELRKVVFAQALEAALERPIDLGGTMEALSATYPSCYRFCFESRDTAFFGATPERLVSLRGRTVETGALAGTIGRGETPAEDEWLAEQLRSDPKNSREHEIVVEAIQEQLMPFAASITVEERSIQRLPGVQHLWTPITAELRSDRDVLSLVEALHPTPAVGGVPPERALDTIRETEPFDRGWYAAPVGWVDAAGNGEFAVALRSALTTDLTATLFAGVGIVEDSDPDQEWDEAQLKFQPILNVLSDEP